MKYDKLTVMADFCSSGIWCKDDNVMVAHEDLELPEDLIKEFDDWIIFYDKECHTPTPRSFVFKPEMAEELNNRGRDLARKLKTLHPDIKIFYRGEVEGDMLDHEEITGV